MKIYKSSSSVVGLSCYFILFHFISLVSSHPTDILKRLVSQVYTKTRNGFDLNLAPYFSVSTFQIGDYDNLSGFYNFDDEVIAYKTKYGWQDNFLFEHSEKIGKSLDFEMIYR